MSLRSINDIENDVENEILESYRERFVENDEEYTLLIEAPNGVVCDMACGLLEDYDIKYVKKADDTLGIFGFSMHPRIYVLTGQFERAAEILSEYGYFDDVEEAAGEEDTDKEPDGGHDENNDK